MVSMVIGLYSYLTSKKSKFNIAKYSFILCILYPRIVFSTDYNYNVIIYNISYKSDMMDIYDKKSLKDCFQKKVSIILKFIHDNNLKYLYENYYKSAQKKLKSILEKYNSNAHFQEQKCKKSYDLCRKFCESDPIDLNFEPSKSNGENFNFAFTEFMFKALSGNPNELSNLIKFLRCAFYSERLILPRKLKIETVKIKHINIQNVNTTSFFETNPYFNDYTYHVILCTDYMTEIKRELENGSSDSILKNVIDLNNFIKKTIRYLEL